jgi:sarcosine oxidase delta subunit
MLPATCPSSANQLTHPPPFLYYYKCLMGCKPKREFWYSFYNSLCLAGESDTNRKSSLTNRNMIYHTVFTTPGAFGCVRQKPKLIHHKPKHASSDSFYHSSGCVYWSETNRNMSTPNRHMYYHTVFTTHWLLQQKPKLIHHKPKHALSDSFYHSSGCVYWSETNRNMSTPNMSTASRHMYYHTILPLICSCTRNRKNHTLVVEMCRRQWEKYITLKVYF